MNLYLISQDENTGYDTFSSCVVCCENEEEARNMHPRGIDIKIQEWRDYRSCWASCPENVDVKFLGVATNGIRDGFICKSFHAG